MFYPNPKLNWNYFNDPNFVPAFSPSVRQNEQPCQSNTQCLYDYRVTGDQQMAQDTKNTDSWIGQLAEFSRASKNSCIQTSLKSDNWLHLLSPYYSNEIEIGKSEINPNSNKMIQINL